VPPLGDLGGDTGANEDELELEARERVGGGSASMRYCSKPDGKKGLET
jgi:hypothetical protein